MGVTESVGWLMKDEEARKIFVSIAKGGENGVSPVELHQLLGAGEWWPLKRILRGLVEHGMVIQSEGKFKSTEEGGKVMSLLASLREFERI